MLLPSSFQCPTRGSISRQCGVCSILSLRSFHRDFYLLRYTVHCIYIYITGTFCFSCDHTFCVYGSNIGVCAFILDCTVFFHLSFLTACHRFCFQIEGLIHFDRYLILLCLCGNALCSIVFASGGSCFKKIKK